MFLENLSEKVWATKGARFVASKRMRRNRIASNAATLFLSSCIIAINLLAFMPKFASNKDEITLFTIVLSSFCLVTTAIINSLNYSHREEEYHKCGLKLDKLNSRIRLFIENEDKEQYKEQCKLFVEEYDEILSRYQFNHTHFDWVYNKYLDERKERKWILKDCLSLENLRYCLQSIKYFIRWNLWDIYMAYCLLAIVPVIGIIYYYFRVCLEQ